jgi:hypothetical protein
VDVVKRICRHKTSFIGCAGSAKIYQLWGSPSGEIIANIPLLLKEDICRLKREVKKYREYSKGKGINP